MSLMMMMMMKPYLVLVDAVYVVHGPIHHHRMTAVWPDNRLSSSQHNKSYLSHVSQRARGATKNQQLSTEKLMLHIN